METIRGRKSLELNESEFQQRLSGYENIMLDLGTGDGRFVRRMAEQHREWFFVGIDACRENLHANSQRKLSNALYIIASAQALPQELNGMASHITINFPWGSLLESLLRNDDCLINGLLSITRPDAGVDIHLNAEALATTGWQLESGAEQIRNTLNAVGWKTKSCSWMDARSLRSFPTTWAKRLAFGRDPSAIRLSLERK